jgi:drug/metabolite transporter (DMT)-like permease
MKTLARPGTGIAFIVLTAICFATSDATAKHLGAALPVLVLLWSRYVFQTTVMGLMQATRRGWRDLLRSSHPKLQLLRATLLVTNTSCSFIGLQHLPLAEFTALAMLAPMASTLLAALLLREKVSPARWAMVLLGFIGMLTIVRPGSGALGWAAALPLTAALLFAGFQIVTNKLSASDDMVTTNLCSGLGAMLMTGVALLVLPIDVVPVLSNASSTEWFFIAVLGAIATLGQLCMVKAIRSAPLSTLTPFAYAQIAFAAVIGWALFNRTPDGWAATGMALIAIGGVTTVWLNARQATSARRAVAVAASETSA